MPGLICHPLQRFAKVRVSRALFRPYIDRYVLRQPGEECLRLISKRIEPVLRQIKRGILLRHIVQPEIDRYGHRNHQQNARDAVRPHFQTAPGNIVAALLNGLRRAKQRESYRREIVDHCLQFEIAGGKRVKTADHIKAG